MMLCMRMLLTCLALSMVSPASAATAPGRADLVALTLAAPVIVRADITATSRLSDRLAPHLAAGFKRHLVRATLRNVLTAPGFVPREIEYLVDIAPDSRGRLTKLKGKPVLLFLNAGSAENQFVLVRPWAQLDWTAEREAYVRGIAAEVVRPGARDFAVTGLRQAFHVSGSLPGEGESQIFLQTASGDPVALVVLSRPGQRRAFSVATGDIIDEAADDVRPGSLLWFHLACSLPPELPPASTETLDAANTAAVADDYRFVIESLGRCDRAYAR